MFLEDSNCSTRIHYTWRRCCSQW